MVAEALKAAGVINLVLLVLALGSLIGFFHEEKSPYTILVVIGAVILSMFGLMFCLAGLDRGHFKPVNGVFIFFHLLVVAVNIWVGFSWVSTMSEEVALQNGILLQTSLLIACFGVIGTSILFVL